MKWSFLTVGGGLSPLQWVSPGPQDGIWRAKHILSRTQISPERMGMTTCQCQSRSPMDITPSHAHPMSFRKAFLPQRPQNRGQPKDTQPGPAPGAVYKHQPSPTQFPPAPEATESEKVSKFHATLHSSGMCFFILSSFLSCVPSSPA